MMVNNQRMSTPAPPPPPTQGHTGTWAQNPPVGAYSSQINTLQYPAYPPPQPQYPSHPLPQFSPSSQGISSPSGGEGNPPHFIYQQTSSQPYGQGYSQNPYQFQQSSSQGAMPPNMRSNTNQTSADILQPQASHVKTENIETQSQAKGDEETADL